METIIPSKNADAAAAATAAAATADFVIHLGDIRESYNQPDCQAQEYRMVSQLFRLSPVPVFVVPGDNDWMDCSWNPNNNNNNNSSSGSSNQT